MISWANFLFRVNTFFALTIWESATYVFLCKNSFPIFCHRWGGCFYYLRMLVGDQCCKTVFSSSQNWIEIQRGKGYAWTNLNCYTIPQCCDLSSTNLSNCKMCIILSSFLASFYVHSGRFLVCGRKILCVTGDQTRDRWLCEKFPFKLCCR